MRIKGSGYWKGLLYLLDWLSYQLWHVGMRVLGNKDRLVHFPVMKWECALWDKGIEKVTRTIQTGSVTSYEVGKRTREKGIEKVFFTF